MTLPGRVPVLLVADDPDLRDGIRALLEFESYEVTIALGYDEALAALRSSRRPALMLVESSTPDGPGIALVGSSREDPDLRRIPAVIVSADRPRDFDFSGMYGFVRKPVDPDELLDRIARSLVAAITVK